MIKSTQDFISNIILPNFDPDELLGKVFMVEHGGQVQKAEITERIEYDTYTVEYADGHDAKYTYAELINLLNKEEEDGHPYWTFSEILNHRKNYNEEGKPLIEVLVKWDTGEPTWEPLNNMKADDPVTIAAYAKEKELQNTPYWRWTTLKDFSISPLKWQKLRKDMDPNTNLVLEFLEQFQKPLHLTKKTKMIYGSKHLIKRYKR